MAERRPEDATPGDWFKVLRRIRFNGVVSGVAGRIVKAVAFCIGTYADYDDGSDVRPGTARVAVDCEIDYRTAKRCMAAIRDVGLIRLVHSGARRGHSDIYQLTLPAGLLDAVEVLTPAEMDREIERIRDHNRRRTAGSGPGNGPGTGNGATRTASDSNPVRVPAAPVQPVDNPPVRVPAAPVPEVPAASDESSTGTAVPPTESSTGTAVPQYGYRYAPLPKQSTETSTTTETTKADLRTAVTVSRASPAVQDPDFRVESTTTDPPERCPAHPSMTGGARPDGLPRCTFCRQHARTSPTLAGPDPPTYAGRHRAGRHRADRPPLRLVPGGQAA